MILQWEVKKQHTGDDGLAAFSWSHSCKQIIGTDHLSIDFLHLVWRGVKCRIYSRRHEPTSADSKIILFSCYRNDPHIQRQDILRRNEKENIGDWDINVTRGCQLAKCVFHHTWSSNCITLFQILHFAQDNTQRLLPPMEKKSEYSQNLCLSFPWDRKCSTVISTYETFSYLTMYWSLLIWPRQSF